MRFMVYFSWMVILNFSNPPEIQHEESMNNTGHRELGHHYFEFQGFVVR